MWQALELEIETVPRKNRCNECGTVFEVHDYNELKCPSCDAFPTFNISGDELEIVYIEVEAAEEIQL